MELSEPPESRNFHHPIIIVEAPKEKKRKSEKKTENQWMKSAVNDIILSRPAIKKNCA